MLDWFSRFWRTSVIGSFLAGLLFLLPIVLTVFIAAYIVNFVRGAIGPGTVLGDLLTWGGTYILGPSQDTLGVLARRRHRLGRNLVAGPDRENEGQKHYPELSRQIVFTSAAHSVDLQPGFPRGAAGDKQDWRAWRPFGHERGVMPLFWLQ